MEKTIAATTSLIVRRRSSSMNVFTNVGVITLYQWKDFLQTWMTHSPQLGDVQNPCFSCVSLRPRSQLMVKYLTNKYYTFCRVLSITPLLMEGFPSNLNDTFTSTRGCAEPMLLMCQLKVKVTIKCQVSQVTTVCIISPFKSFNFLSINSSQYVESAC